MKNQQEWDWDKIPTGSTFTAKIHRTLCEGRIFKDTDNTVYLCQNKQDGTYAPNKLGYKHSWRTPNKSSLEDLKRNNIENLLIWLPEKGYKVPVEIKTLGPYDVVIRKNKIKVGCTPVSFEQVEAVYKKMLNLRKSKSDVK